jgi:hypothetical protein
MIISSPTHLALLQALEELLLQGCGVGGRLGHGQHQLLLLALGGWVEGHDVLPAEGLGAEGLDLLHVDHLAGVVVVGGAGFEGREHKQE